MLIVIEGVDKTGKSTLAGKLSEKTGAEVRHASAPKGHPVDDYELSLLDYDPRTSKLVLDRFHLGEFVWPRIFERKTQFTDGVARHVELFLRSRGAWLVYAERALGNLEHDIRIAVPPEPIRPDQVGDAMRLFEKALKFAHGPVSTWNFERDKDDKLDGIIAAAEVTAEAAAVPWEVTDEWIGYPEPEVLLVGDEFGARTSRPDSVPFSPTPNSCGLYLMEALPAEWWSRCALVNVHRGRTGTPHRNFTDFWEALQTPKVVALGKRASEALDFFGLSHKTVPHPQYWKRFHHHQEGQYTELLKEAA